MLNFMLFNRVLWNSHLEKWNKYFSFVWWLKCVLCFGEKKYIKNEEKFAYDFKWNVVRQEDSHRIENQVAQYKKNFNHRKSTIYFFKKVHKERFIYEYWKSEYFYFSFDLLQWFYSIDNISSLWILVFVTI